MRETGRDKDDDDKAVAAGATVGTGDTSGIFSGGIVCGTLDGDSTCKCG